MQACAFIEVLALLQIERRNSLLFNCSLFHETNQVHPSLKSTLCWSFLALYTTALTLHMLLWMIWLKATWGWKWKLLSHVRLFATLWTLQSMEFSRPAFPFPRGSYQPRDQTQVSRIAGGFFTSWASREAQDTGVGSLCLLQGIFPTQLSNQGLLHCRWILYQLSY